MLVFFTGDLFYIDFSCFHHDIIEEFKYAAKVTLIKKCIQFASSLLQQHNIERKCKSEKAFCLDLKSFKYFVYIWDMSSLPSSSWRKHQVEIVSHILIEVWQQIVVVSKVDVGLVVVIVVGINVVVDVQNKSDDWGNKTHVTKI